MFIATTTTVTLLISSVTYSHTSADRFIQKNYMLQYVSVTEQKCIVQRKVLNYETAISESKAKNGMRNPLILNRTNGSYCIYQLPK